MCVVLLFCVCCVVVLCVLCCCSVCCVWCAVRDAASRLPNGEGTRVDVSSITSLVGVAHDPTLSLCSCVWLSEIPSLFTNMCQTYRYVYTHTHTNSNNNNAHTQLNNAVSGALDRLHYEKDPCVRYDSTRKVWIYLHRGRNEEDFGKNNIAGGSCVFSVCDGVLVCV